MLLAKAIIAAGVLAPTVSSAAANVVAAGDTRLEVNLPAGPLQATLDSFSRLAGLQVLYDPDLVRGHVTQEVRGSMTPAEALRKLLAPTDIGFEFTAKDAVALYRRSPSVSPAAPVHNDEVLLPMQPPTVTVTGQRRVDGSYVADTASSSMRVDVSPLHAPVMSQSVTQQVLRDRQATRLEDVLEDISTVEVVPSGQSAAGFAIRGFPAYQYYVDGLRVSPDLYHDGFRDLANAERVDVVKGPASVLYGRTEPGGIINIVTKEPASQPILSLLQVSTLERHRTQVDAGGPLRGHELLYRVNAAYETGHSLREGASNHRVFLAPTVSWRPSSNAQTRIYLEYLNSFDTNILGLPVVGDQLPAVPVGRTFGAGGEVHTRDLRIGLAGSLTLGKEWVLRPHFDARWLHTPQSAELVPAGRGLFSAACTQSLCPGMLYALPLSRGRTAFGSLELAGAVNFGPSHHALLFGAELFAADSYNELLARIDPALAIDLNHPQPMPVAASLLDSPDLKFATRTTERWNAVYAQDQIDIGGQLHVLLGGRYDYARQSLSIRAGYPTPEQSTQNARQDHSFKRRAGVVWNPTEHLSIYTNYLENFGIAAGLYLGDPTGTRLLVPPESAHEWEIGVKKEFFENRAMASLSWFDLTKVNLAIPSQNPVLAAQGFRSLTGPVRNRGLELNLQGEIAPNLQLIASYAYINSRILSTVATGFGASGPSLPDSQNVGKRFFGVPLHGGSAWMSYRYPWGGGKSLKFGAGAVVRGAREGDNANDYRIPGFAKWSTMAAYDWRAGDARLTLQLNVDNLFDTTYFESRGGDHTVLPGDPRRWTASLGVQF